MPMSASMGRNQHESCGVRSFNGIDYIASHRGAPCPQVARYSGTFRDSLSTEQTTIGLCEYHASEAFLPVEMGQRVPALPAVLISMHSIPHEVWQRNLARASFADLVSA